MRYNLLIQTKGQNSPDRRNSMKAPVVINSNTLLSLIELNKGNIAISTELSSLNQTDDFITTMVDSVLDIEIDKNVNISLFIFATVHLEDVEGNLACVGLDHNVETTGLAILNLNNDNEVVVEFENEFYTLNEMCDNTSFKEEIIQSKMMNYDTDAVNRMLNNACVNSKQMAYA